MIAAGQLLSRGVLLASKLKLFHRIYAGLTEIEDTFWSGPEPVAAMPRRSSFPALAISSLWKALPSSGQRPTQRAQSLNQPLALSRTPLLLTVLSASG